MSVSVGVVLGLTLPPLSSGMEDESPLRPGSTPATHKHTHELSKVKWCLFFWMRHTDRKRIHGAAAGMCQSMVLKSMVEDIIEIFS